MIEQHDLCCLVDCHFLWLLSSLSNLFLSLLSYSCFRVPLQMFKDKVIFVPKVWQQVAQQSTAEVLRSLWAPSIIILFQFSGVEDGLPTSKILFIFFGTRGPSLSQRLMWTFPLASMNLSLSFQGLQYSDETPDRLPVKPKKSKGFIPMQLPDRPRNSLFLEKWIDWSLGQKKSNSYSKRNLSLILEQFF